jgi:hypothetical protein
LPTNDISKNESNINIEIKESEKLKIINSPSVSQNKMVRTDCSEQKIEKFLNKSDTSMLMLGKSQTDDVIKR